MLEYETRTVKVVKYKALEDFINKEFAIPKQNDHWGSNTYNIIAENEWNNDSTYEVTARAEELLDGDEEDLEDFLNWAAGKGEQPSYINIGTLLSYLVKQGRMEPGNYLVEVCW